MNKVVIKDIEIDGKKISVELGKVARLAAGSCVVTMGTTRVLGTVTVSKEPNTSIDYFPLTVHYTERFYAAGKIPGGFLKREGRPRDRETLTARLIDRPLRPLFPKGFKNEVLIIALTISADQKNSPDVLAMLASSLSVLVSEIPWDGPIAGVRVGMVEGKYLINPDKEELEKSKLDIIVAGTKDAITMVEGLSSEVSEEELLEACKIAHVAIKKLCEFQEEVVKEIRREKLTVPEAKTYDDIKSKTDSLREGMSKALFIKEKRERSNTLDSLTGEFVEKLSTELKEDDEAEAKIKAAKSFIDDLEKDIVRKSILEKKLRADGRGPEDIRQITIDLDYLPQAHGSALFTRGETQALAVLTLGDGKDEQLMDDIEGEKRTKRFMLHYNFPPFSVGETGRYGFTGRREIGHGNLAERALAHIIPEEIDFAYTIRIVSDILESNGSSSMASVCGGTLAMMAGGVPIKNPVAGVAMGLVYEEGKYEVLTDILGLEDHLGDMDFKVAGTANGITSFQMDVKISGLSFDIMEKALAQAKKARLSILDTMNKAIADPRKELSPLAPKIVTINVPTDKIGEVIGPGGKVIKGITELTGCQINIDDSGLVKISGYDKEQLDKALEIVSGIGIGPEVGKIYDGTVVKVMDFGAFVAIFPGKEGLCHIKEFSDERIEKARDFVNEGDALKVKLLEIDKLGRLNLSHKEAIRAN